ncbi:MAG TPA: ubiquinol-cytochrome c reductase iron-sulfur subunit [Thermodesulfobacteriota bacterium]|jgi:menaquinol-cytochrome c reductase iron-sulfur subunit|nr:ubiquinol-cytochrome c reductase iron-sulfur subunit [Thermodesulfobacteriota bacterium]
MERIDSNAFVATDLSVSRRAFLKGMVGVLSALVAAATAVPLIGAIIGPSFREKKAKWVQVGDIGSLALGQPVNLKFPFKMEDAYLRETVIHNVWVIKHSSTEITVYSPICPHLGCHYDWHPTQNEFICPCHGSVYAIDGKVLGGPAPRPLDTLPTRLEKGELFVEWEIFKVGIPEKIPV